MDPKEELGTETPHGINERIRSNGLNKCLHCGVEITEENDSGWEHFTEEPGRTQKVCKNCDKKSNQQTEKED